MSTGPLLVTARLASPLALGADGPPQLDALLEWSLSPFYVGDQKRFEPGFKITRSGPAPPQGAIPIPILRVSIPPWNVAMCSDAILPASRETVEHVNKRLATEAADLLRPEERKIVSTTNTWTKSYRLPLRVLAVPCVRWFCHGNRRNLLKALRDVRALGKKVSDGYGRISGWEAEDTPEDHSWFAKHPDGVTVLMRRLPLLCDGRAWLPENLVGCKCDFGACCPPYWHPERNTEVMVPC